MDGTFNVTCPDGYYISELSGTSGELLDTIQAKCNNGTILQQNGGPGGGNAWKNQGPFTEISGNSGEYIDNLLGHGGAGGNPFGDHCPQGTMLTGYSGNTGVWRDTAVVSRLNFQCGVDKVAYCKNINNIDSTLCADITPALLNEHCVKNINKTLCKNRFTELTPTTLTRYCKDHGDDSMCACYEQAPLYLPASIKGKTNCWSKNARCPNTYRWRCAIMYVKMLRYASEA
jgi:hypothetical protein